MHVRPYHRDPDWQRFLAGCVIGVFVGFALFLFQFGTAQERQINRIRELKAEMDTLIEQKQIMLEEAEQKNKTLENKLTVQEVKIHIIDDETDVATKTELEHVVAEELHPVINRSISSVAENRELIEKAVEHKPFTVSEMTYHFRIRSLVIYSTVTLDLTISEREDNSR